MKFAITCSIGPTLINVTNSVRYFRFSAMGVGLSTRQYSKILLISPLTSSKMTYEIIRLNNVIVVVNIPIPLYPLIFVSMPFTMQGIGV